MLKMSISSLIVLVRYLLLVALLIYFWKCVIAYMYMQVVYLQVGTDTIIFD